MKKILRVCLGLGFVLAVGVGARGGVLTGSITTGAASGGGEVYDYLIDRACVVDLGPASLGASISGTVSNLSFGTSGDSSSGSWLEVGFVAKNRADASIDTYGVPSYMFNQSAFLLSYETSGGDLVVMPADTDMGYGSVGPGGPGGGSGSDYFDLGTASGFSFTLDVIPDGSGPGGDINLTVVGQTGTKTWKYGYDNWEWVWWKTGSTGDPGESEFDGDFRYAYCLAQGYANTDDGSVNADVSASCSQIPEPASILVWSVLSLICVGAYRWRRRSGVVAFGGARQSKQPARQQWPEGTTDAILEIIERGRMNR